MKVGRLVFLSPFVVRNIVSIEDCMHAAFCHWQFVSKVIEKLSSLVFPLITPGMLLFGDLANGDICACRADLQPGEQDRASERHPNFHLRHWLLPRVILLQPDFRCVQINGDNGCREERPLQLNGHNSACVEKALICRYQRFLKCDGIADKPWIPADGKKTTELCSAHVREWERLTCSIDKVVPSKQFFCPGRKSLINGILDRPNTAATKNCS